MPLYLDNAATSFPKPEAVYRAVEHALREIGVGPGRGGHRRGLDANRVVFEAREALAALFHIRDSSRIVFTHNATESLNLGIAGMLRAGDHAVTTTMEHNSVVRPLHRAELVGVEVTRVPCDARGLLRVEDLEAALTPRTRMVVMSHCSNVTGAIQPVAEVGRIARSRGIIFLLDAAQSAGAIPLDVEESCIDLLAAPGHKGLLGPQGTGFLYLAPGLEPEPLQVGGTGGASEGAGQPLAAPERYESGTMNLPGIAGLRAGAEFLLETGVERVRSHEAALMRLLREGMRALPGVRLYGPQQEELSGAVLSFTVQGMDPSVVGFRLDQEFEIAVRVGLHCAPDAHRTIGTYPDGTIRVSPGYFTTEQDIEEFLQALGHIVG